MMERSRAQILRLRGQRLRMTQEGGRATRGETLQAMRPQEDVSEVVRHLLLDAGGGNPLHDQALEEQEEDEDRDKSQRGHGEHRAPGGGVGRVQEES